MRFGILLLSLMPFPAQAKADAAKMGRIQPPSKASPTHSYDWRLAVRGTLKNGMRYAILPRRGSEAGAGLFMRVEGGFIAERRPGERGLAHLIEHVAFESPTNEAPEDLHHVRRVGGPLTLPAPSAGTTSSGDSTYFLTSRSVDPGDLDTLLMLFRDMASGLTFRADSVDGQRADVIREMAGKKPGNALYASYIAAVAPGSPNDLIQAQNSDDVATASIETIRALYHRLYRPERTTMVIVGDVDPAGVATLIRQRFEGWQGVGPAPKPQLAPTFQTDRIAPISYSAAQGRTGVTISVTMPLPPSSPTREKQIQSMLSDLVAVGAVDARLRRAQPDSPPGKVGITIENADGYRMLRLLDHVSLGQWPSSLAVLTQTVCDLTGKGLSDADWSAAKLRTIQDLERRATDTPTIRNVDLAAELGRAIVTGEDPVAPGELLDYARKWLPTLSSRTGNGWLRDQWHSGVEHVRVESPELTQVDDPRSAIRAVLDRLRPQRVCKVPKP
jgi:Peptidase M16 inactive domain/Insulinase (Peptidase family M16)